MHMYMYRGMKKERERTDLCVNVVMLSSYLSTYLVSICHYLSESI